ncbi:hypothetical protein [Parasitella parasitica]|uniref:Uncharacterized protein n=1 Tax=Parasitella parasitica TaxID=35722 RepID=A0A0B7N6B2_9FUNG|nr:hypothetical protein [Parasitella parasitica]
MVKDSNKKQPPAQKKRSNAQRIASKRHYLKNKASILNSTKVKFFELEIKHKLVVRGTSTIEEDMLRKVFLGQFALSLQAFFEQTNSSLTDRDVYQLCYAFGSLFLLSKQIINSNNVYNVRSLGRFPNAYEFFLNNGINPRILQRCPSELTLKCSILATFLPNFEGLPTPCWDLQSHHSNEFEEVMDASDGDRDDKESEEDIGDLFHSSDEASNFDED